MTTQEFFNKWNNKGADFDGAYGNQCMDVYQYFNRDVVGAFHVPNPSAADVWGNYPANFYTKIPNSPTAVPQAGDIVIWKKGASLPFGHIAIATGKGDTSSFESFDQNWPTGSICHYQKHDYKLVVGWLRPNKFIQDPAIITQPIAQDHTQCKKDLQKANDRIQELDGIVDKDTHEISRLNQENEALRWQIKSIDEYSVSELLGALVRKLGGNAKPKEQG